MGQFHPIPPRHGYVLHAGQCKNGLMGGLNHNLFSISIMSIKQITVNNMTTDKIRLTLRKIESKSNKDATWMEYTFKGANGESLVLPYDAEPEVSLDEDIEITINYNPTGQTRLTAYSE